MGDWMAALCLCMRSDGGELSPHDDDNNTILSLWPNCQPQLGSWDLALVSDGRTL